MSEYNKQYRESKSKEIYTRRSSPKGRYLQQKQAASRRNIPWEFTFETWWKMWEESGQWDNRGRIGYMMCRNKDTGPYSPTNVRIDTCQNNIQEMFQIKRSLSCPT